MNTKTIEQKPLSLKDSKDFLIAEKFTVKTELMIFGIIYGLTSYSFVMWVKNILGLYPNPEFPYMPTGFYILLMWFITFCAVCGILFYLHRVAKEEWREKKILQALGRTDNLADIYEGLLFVEVKGWPVREALEHTKVGFIQFTLDEYELRMETEARDTAKKLGDMLPGTKHDELSLHFNNIRSTETWKVRTERGVNRELEIKVIGHAITP